MSAVPAFRPDLAVGRTSRDEAPSLSRAVVATLAVTCLVHVALAVLTRQAAIYVGDDDAGYILLARAIREGHYHALQHVGLPWEARFPPGYPLLLAAVTALFGEKLDVMLMTGIVVSIIGLLLLFDLVRRRWSPGFALVVCGLAAMNPSLVHNAGRIQSETLFTTSVILAFWLAERTRGDERRSRAATAMTLVVAGYAALVRSIGVVLLISLGATWAIQRRRRSAVLAALLAIVIGGGWSLWTAMAPDAAARRTYGNVLAEWVFGRERPSPIRTEAGVQASASRDPATEVGDARGAERRSFIWRLSHRVPRSAVSYATDYVPWVLGAPLIGGTMIDNALWLVACLACVIAGASVMWSRVPQVVAYTGFYGAFLLFWPAYLARFAEPLIPFIILWLLVGAGVLGDRFVRRWPRAVPATMALLLVPTAATRNAAALTLAAQCPRSASLTSQGCASEDVRAFVAAARFARALPPGDSVFVTVKERPFYYYSGRRTIVLGSAVDRGADTLAAYLRHTPARMVVIGRVGFNAPYQALRAGLLASCRDFDVVSAFPPSALMLRVRGVADSPPQADACEAIRRLPLSTKGFD